MTILLSRPVSLAIQQPTAISGFGSGSDLGSISNGVWTPGRDASGLVNLVSWQQVPRGTWVVVAGSNPSALDPLVKSLVPTFVDPNWKELFGGTWSGMAKDHWTGSRAWFFGGGHSTSWNNGVYRFDAFKMKWDVERGMGLPSGTANISAGWDPATYLFDPVSIRATLAKYDAGPVNSGLPGTLNTINDVYCDELLDGKPIARHTYGWMTYCQGQNRILFQRSGRLWSYNLTTQAWDYKRVTGDYIGSRLQIYNTDLVPPTYYNGVGLPPAPSTNYGGYLQQEGGTAFWDENTQTWMACQNGANGYPTSASFNWATKTWGPWTDGLASGWGQSGDTRIGRLCVKITQPYGTGSAYGQQGPDYWTYNLDTRITTQGRCQFAPGTSYDDFLPFDSAHGFDSPAIEYMPSINRYWCYFMDSKQVIRLFEIDPTTSPWTCSKTAVGSHPVANTLYVLRRLQYFSAINAAVLLQDGVTPMMLYKF